MKYRDEERYHNRRMIEIELRNYRANKKEIELIREDIYSGSSFQEVCVQSGKMGNPTQNKALRLCEFEYIESDRKMKAIELGVRELQKAEDEDFYKIILMKYFENRFEDFRIMDELHLSKSSFWRKHQNAINVFAKYFGWKI